MRLAPRASGRQQASCRRRPSRALHIVQEQMEKRAQGGLRAHRVGLRIPVVLLEHHALHLRWTQRRECVTRRLDPTNRKTKIDQGNPIPRRRLPSIKYVAPQTEPTALHRNTSPNLEDVSKRCENSIESMRYLMTRQLLDT